MVSRRAFLHSTALGLLTHAGPGRAMAAERTLRIPRPEELASPVLVQAAGLTGIADIEHLGTSGGGRPIDLISVGEGTRAALIVGAPHANEPIGCATIRQLLGRLGADRVLRDRSGWRWHFIPAIDIDGLALNAGWFGAAPSFERYLAHFFRPPFRLQPEYAFPLETATYRFDSETPESRCWRAALDRLRPALHCSLHGADSGGSFFLASRCLSGLCPALASLPHAYGITLNEIGDSSARTTELQPGIFSFDDIRASLSEARAAGRDPARTWRAGDSSAGYSGRHYGTFNLTCEVPLWRDARERDPARCGQTLAAVLGEQIRQLRTDRDLIGPVLARVAARVGTPAQHALLTAVQEALGGTDAAVLELQEAEHEGSAQRILSRGELVQYEAGTAGMRTLAMAARLGRLTHSSAALAPVLDELARRRRAFEAAARLRCVPLSASTGLQSAAILAAARALTQES